MTTSEPKVTDAMARAFFAALDDGELSGDDIAEIKLGLTAALRVMRQEEAKKEQGETA